MTQLVELQRRTGTRFILQNTSDVFTVEFDSCSRTDLMAHLLLYVRIALIGFESDTGVKRAVLALPQMKEQQ